MSLSFLLWLAALGATTPTSVRVEEASNALAQGRVDQARLMIADLVESGVDNAAVDRLLGELSALSGDHDIALARFEAALAAHPGDPVLLERSGVAAFRAGNLQRATSYLEQATADRRASWSAWNARAVVADHRGDWAAAEEAYERAARLAPQEARIANNRGWSAMIQGRWADAVPLLEQAVRLDPRLKRAVNNLDLARASVAADLPARRAGESDSSWSARLNDAGEVRNDYYARAANNLAAIEGRP